MTGQRSDVIQGEDHFQVEVKEEKEVDERKENAQQRLRAKTVTG